MISNVGSEQQEELVHALPPVNDADTKTNYYWLWNQGVDAYRGR